MKAISESQNHFADISKMVGPHFRTNGAKLYSPGQRPGNEHPTYSPSPNGAKPNARRTTRVTPRWGLGYFHVPGPRGDAPGYRVDAPLARKNLRTKGAKPCSLGQRPRTERAKPNTEAHK